VSFRLLDFLSWSSLNAMRQEMGTPLTAGTTPALWVAFDDIRRRC
jgi:hypothetical protein